MRKTIIVGAAITASLAIAGTAQADTVGTGFDNFDPGTGIAGKSVNGQRVVSTDPASAWKSTGPYDQGIVNVNSNKMLRISNAVTSGSFGNQTFSNPVNFAASEYNADNVFVTDFTIKAPENFVQGLRISVSPDDGQGGRMSYLRFEDTDTGVRVIFREGTYIEDQLIATLDRKTMHSIRIESTFVQGHDDDVVRIFIDDEMVKRGGSWENYFRAWQDRNPYAVDRVLFLAGGTAAPLTKDSGFLIDDVWSSSSHVDNPAPLHSVVLPQGPKGDTGAAGPRGEQGAKGEPGATVVIPSAPLASKVAALHGNTLRTIHAPKVHGMKFVSVKASLRGKRLSVKGRAVKADLRSRPAGNYAVQMTAKYRKNGKVVTVRSIRTLKVTLSS